MSWDWGWSGTSIVGGVGEERGSQSCACTWARLSGILKPSCCSVEMERGKLLSALAIYFHIQEGIKRSHLVCEYVIQFSH